MSLKEVLALLGFEGVGAAGGLSEAVAKVRAHCEVVRDRETVTATATACRAGTANRQRERGIEAAIACVCLCQGKRKERGALGEKVPPKDIAFFSRSWPQCPPHNDSALGPAKQATQAKQAKHAHTRSRNKWRLTR